MARDYFATGELKFDSALIFNTFPMGEVAEACKFYMNPKDVHGKILLINH